MTAKQVVSLWLLILIGWGNRPQSSVHRRSEAGKPCRAVHLVWRKSVEKQLVRVKKKMKALTGLTTSAAVRSMLEGESRGIAFVRGKGKHNKARPSATGKRSKALLERWERYEEMLSTMGEGRNSYSKTGYRRHLHADERRPFEERAAETRIQCPDCGKQRVYYRPGSIFRPDRCENAASHAGHDVPGTRHAMRKLWQMQGMKAWRTTCIWPDVLHKAHQLMTRKEKKI